MEKQSDCKIGSQSNEYILKEGLTRDIIADNMVHNNRLFIFYGIDFRKCELFSRCKLTENCQYEPYNTCK